MPSPNRGNDKNAFKPFARLVKQASRVFKPDPAQEEEARRQKELAEQWDMHYLQNEVRANRHDLKNFKTNEGPIFVDGRPRDAREVRPAVRKLREKPSLVQIRAPRTNPSSREGSRSRTGTPAQHEGDRRPTPPPKDPGYVPYGDIQIGLQAPEHLPMRQLHSERRREG